MIKTALLEKLAHGQRSRVSRHVEYAMEFSDLLDEVAPEQSLTSAKPDLERPHEPIVVPTPVPTEPDVTLADLVMFPVRQRADNATDRDPVAEQPIDVIIDAPAKISRFAASGFDDDLLPVRPPRHRLRR